MKHAGMTVVLVAILVSTACVTSPQFKIASCVNSPQSLSPSALKSDNLMLLKGIGPKLNTLLAAMGVTQFEQIAQWTADDIAEVERSMDNFAGRIERDHWVEQARYLACGDKAGFEAKYGDLGSEL